MGKKKIALIAKEVKFTYHSVVYLVEVDSKLSIKNNTHPIFCPNDISEKELLLKPTILDTDKMNVVYGLTNMTPHFYEQILNENIYNYLELKYEIKNIYDIGDIVGYILV